MDNNSFRVCPHDAFLSVNWLFAQQKRCCDCRTMTMRTWLFFGYCSMLLSEKILQLGVLCVSVFFA